MKPKLMTTDARRKEAVLHGISRARSLSILLVFTIILAPTARTIAQQRIVSGSVTSTSEHRATQLLEQRWCPASQIAYEVGFSNLSYFSKAFKEEFGVLPSEYTVEKMD